MSTTQTKTASYRIGTLTLIDAMKRLVEPGPMDPHSEIHYWNTITAVRGYDYFSRESMEDWLSAYGKITYPEIAENAKTDFQRFMIEVKTPGMPNHNTSRLMFLGSFNSKEHLAESYFLEESKNKLGGEFLRPVKNHAYQDRILKTGAQYNNHVAFEYQTMKNLFLAKWSAVGYFEDEAYKKRFIDEYCVAYNGK